jgi:hypothetical protein
MDKAIHHFSELFAQLGLPNDAHSIAHFLSAHATPVEDSFRLPDAPYWTASQSSFLRESLTQDADWSDVVDQLAKALQKPTTAASP